MTYRVGLFFALAEEVLKATALCSLLHPKNEMINV